MKKGQIGEGIVTRVDFPDKAVIEMEGETVMVKYGLPGQKLRFVISKKKGGHLEGRILEVLSRSPEEKKEAECPHYPVCGGCNYSSLTPEAENAIKDAQVRRLLEPVIGTGIFEGVKEPPRQTEYRNKMEFSFGDEEKGGPLTLGMHCRGSFYDVVTVSECRIADADFRKILTAAVEFFSGTGVLFYQKMQHRGYLRHLLVRKGEATGEILIDLVTTSRIEFCLSGEGGNGQLISEPFDENRLLVQFTEKMRELSLDGRITGILHTVNDSLADVVQSDRTECLYGRDYFYEKLLGLKFKITPFSFFQTNSSGAEVLYRTVREYIGETEHKVIYDLYSGTGTIAQILAPVARKVVGVEIVKEAVEAAKQNAELNGLSNCEFIAGDVLTVLDSLTQKPDLIVLDPPREGIHPRALPKIIGYQVERMVYISCKPTSLARDLVEFYAGGYEVTRACSVNMFCRSANIETVCLLGRRKSES